jgi:sugar O-acyltransferase (sialic acid O-acetyltransferase NeuD family)
LPQLLLVGGGGHCRSCIEVIESTADWTIGGIVDASLPLGSRVLGYEIIGSDERLPGLLSAFPQVLITVGQIKSSAVRRRLWEALLGLGYSAALIVSASAHVSRHAEVGAGTIVMHHAFVNAAARVGVNCIVNTGAVIEHEAVVGDHCHISTGALVNGDCELGEGCFIGSGAIIKNGISIARETVVGAGAVVIKDILDPGIYVGNPARMIHE